MLPLSVIVLMLLTLGLLFPKEKEGAFSVIKHKQNAAFNIDLTESRDSKVFQEGETRKKRQNLIIVAHGRSGSTFLGNIFNHHPNVFYLFEPYQTVERLHGSVAPENQEYQEKAFQWMKSVFRCDFVTSDHVKDLEEYYRRKYAANYNPLKSLALLSPPFCPYNATDLRWKVGSCPPLDQKTLEETCKTKYSITVVKALFNRMPSKSLKQLLTICDTHQFDCKFLFLVRDPRAIIPSSNANSFFKDDTSLEGTRDFSQEICRTTEMNLNIIRFLPSVEKRRFLLLRYEDLAVDPLIKLQSLLKFAGLPMDETAATWLDLASHRPESESERKAATWRQDSWEGAQRWRWKVRPRVISVIEDHCNRVMSVLGYKAVGGSHELQKNLTVRLLQDRYDALEWFEDASNE